uniref:(northern house mosquito) hypothetical protein n=1 Tax=Culex pipiens TaxID=7175 RepID=A0A8D7ZVV2_CULPI
MLVRLLGLGRSVRCWPSPRTAAPKSSVWFWLIRLSGCRTPRVRSGNCGDFAVDSAHMWNTDNPVEMERIRMNDLDSWRDEGEEENAEIVRLLQDVVLLWESFY